ncbi:MAG: mandelate racemase [Candidatus Latescibacterota bacterium]|jgi:hypothetical protein
MVQVAKVRIKDVEFFVRNAPMRMPFRFGAVTLTSSAVLHVHMRIEMENGQLASGWAADMLAPKWFDKDPDKSYEKNLHDLVDAAQAAAAAYLQIGAQPSSGFAIWRAGYDAGIAWGDAHGLNRLTASNGPSLQERALIDAIGAGCGLSYHQILTENVLGLEFGDIHPELQGVQPVDIIASQPLSSVEVRHTVGLIDPIRRADIADQDRLEDGLPQSLEEYIEHQGIRYLKIKIGGDAESDYSRLADIAALLAEKEVAYSATLDGNEQYGDMDALGGLLERVERELPAMYERLLYIEQPLDRAVALDESLAADIAAVSARKPMLIDESDEELDTFKRATALGYRGVSSKACKGLIKALANAALVRHLDDGSGQFFISAEDLTNIAVVPLHQDLVHVAALGIEHVERNGHHYVRGLDHLSEREREVCRREHASLYRQAGSLLSLDIRHGKIDLSSLQRPGLGGGEAVDETAMTRLQDWQMTALTE